MDNFWIVVLLVVAILVVAFLYRRGAFKAGMKALGFEMNVEGRGGPEADAPKPSVPTPSAAPPPAPGTGQRNIHVGRDAQGTFVTGDNNRVAQVEGDRNRVDQAGKV
jgi:hypothetical protein